MAKRPPKTAAEIRAAEMFGASLRSLRTEHDWRAEDVGQAIGISGDRVSKYERGEREPSILLLLRLSQLFGVTIDRLICGHSTRPRLAPIAKIDAVSQPAPDAGKNGSAGNGKVVKASPKGRGSSARN